MVKRAILFSAILSIISLVVVAYTPSEVFVRDSEKVRSPYDNELEEIHKKTDKGLLSSDPIWVKRDELIKKNQDWYKNYREEYIKNSATTALGAWKKKSSFLAPGIMVLWGVLFYFFYRRKPSNYAPLVLVFPIILTIAQLMPILEFVLIAFAVFAVWFWFLLNPPNTSPPETKTI